jgi:hypothetical protein
MADISKITLPSGNTYDIKDATARELIAGGITFNVVYDGTSTPEVANIPEGVVVTYNGTDYTGTKTAASADAGTFYLVASGTSPNAYDEYVVAGPSGGRFWERLGGKDIDLSNLGALAYKDNVTLSKGSGDNVLGEATTFTAAASAVSFAAHTTDNFVKSVSAVTGKKLVTTTVPNVTGNTDVSIPNVTNAGSASTWNFAMGTGTAAETLIISGANSTAPTLGTALSASKVTLGTAKTVATGALSESGTGDAVVSDVQVGESAAAITALGAGTAAAQSITVGTNDKVAVAKYGDLNVSVS